MRHAVTILITVYNRTDYLRTAIESALDQSFSDFEVLVLDDSGAAIAKDLCDPYLSSGKVRYRPNPKTLGVAESLRTAIEDCESDYISILNDDDRLEPGFLAALVPPLQADPRRVLAFSDHWLMDAEGRLDLKATEENTRFHGRQGLPEGEVANLGEFLLASHGVPLAVASVFRKDALDASLLTAQVAGAYDFWISCALASTGGAFYHVPGRFSCWRIHPEMETARRSADKSDCAIHIASQLVERGWFPGFENLLRRRLADAFFRAGLDRMDFSRVTEAMRYFFKSLSASPGWRPLLAMPLCLLPRPVRQKIRTRVMAARRQPA
jgi:glycosyltransferase involved in cell wall biosynthesis